MKVGPGHLMVALLAQAGAGKGTLLKHMQSRSQSSFSIRSVSVSGAIKKYDPTLEKRIKEGHLITDDIVNTVLAEQWNLAVSEQEETVWFDGAPRSVSQAEKMRSLAKESGSRFVLFNLTASSDKCVERIAAVNRGRGEEDDPAVIRTRHAIHEANLAGIMQSLMEADIPCFTIDNSLDDMGEKMFRDVSSHIIPYIPVRTSKR